MKALIRLCIRSDLDLRYPHTTRKHSCALRGSYCFWISQVRDCWNRISSAFGYSDRETVQVYSLQAPPWVTLWESNERLMVLKVWILHTEHISLRKHAYSCILKISPPKNWKFSDKNPDIFHIHAQNIDCGYSLEPPRRGGSNQYPQSMFLSRNKKNNVYLIKPQFYYIKLGFKGIQII